MKRNKWIALALCAALTCSLAACGTKAPDEPADPAAGSVQIPNPWTDCETMEDAAGGPVLTLRSPILCRRALSFPPSRRWKGRRSRSSSKRMM